MKRCKTDNSHLPRPPYVPPLNEEKMEFCSTLNKFHSFLSEQFRSLGYVIANSPSYFIIIPLLITLLSLTGFQAMIYEKDPEYLFSPTNGQGREERKVVKDLFPLNYSHSFDPSRLTEISSFARLLVTARDNDTMFRTMLWDDIAEVDRAIQNLTIEWEASTYTYRDVCAKWNSQCIENSILALREIMPEIVNGSRWVDYPVMFFPLVFPFYYGGVEVNETEGIATSVLSISLTYWFKEDTWKERARSKMFEQKILELLDVTEFEHIRIARYVSASLENELEKNTNSVIGYLPPTAIIMVIFSILGVFEFDWVRSKVQVGVMGVVTAAMATGCSFGLLMYCEIPFIGINLAAPFLLLGIGIDDMFVLLSAWNRTNIQDDVPKRLSEAYSEAAVSITITSITNMLSFFIGAITPFPSVYIFCIYTGVAILLTYVYFITFFGGCLALAGYHEKKQRHAVSCKPVKAKSEEGNGGWWHFCFCTGGINNNDPWNPRDNKPHMLMKCFKDYVATLINYSVVKVLIMAVFVVYLGGAIYGCLQIKEGLEKRNLALDESYLIDYYDVEDILFRKFPYRIQVIINENITYSDPNTQKQLNELHEAFENLTCIGPSLYTQSWIRGFYNYVYRRPRLKQKITDETSFIKVLKEEYLIPETPEYLDVVFNEDHTRIIASRFIIQSHEVMNTNEDSNMMQAVRKVANEASFRVVAYHPFFVLFDQFLLVKPLTIQTISTVALIMMVISLIFIPNPLCSLWVIFSIVSIEVGVLGYMSLWGVSLDCISMINLIMCIGFSVDFSAHISYAYLTAKEDSPDEKVKECLFNLGLPVVQSGLSTIAGVLIFILAPSYIFHTFFKIIFLVIIFGSMHALLLLPVMLSLLGPGSCIKKDPAPVSVATATSSQCEPTLCTKTSSDSLRYESSSGQDSGHGSLRSTTSVKAEGCDNPTFIHEHNDSDSVRTESRHCDEFLASTNQSLVGEEVQTLS